MALASCTSLLYHAACNHFFSIHSHSPHFEYWTAWSRMRLLLGHSISHLYLCLDSLQSTVYIDRPLYLSKQTQNWVPLFTYRQLELHRRVLAVTDMMAMVMYQCWAVQVNNSCAGQSTWSRPYQYLVGPTRYSTRYWLQSPRWTQESPRKAHQKCQD